jgi:uncharacterized protein
MKFSRWGGYVRKCFLGLMFLGLLTAAGCHHNSDSASDTGKDCTKAVPADGYCLNMGYSCSIKADTTGNEFATCRFPNGQTCDTWQFFRGSCGQDYSFCARQGARVVNRVEDMGGWTAEYAVCLFADNSECGEQEYLAGSCAPGACNRWRLSQGGCMPF